MPYLAGIKIKNTDDVEANTNTKIVGRISDEKGHFLLACPNTDVINKTIQFLDWKLEGA